MAQPMARPMVRMVRRSQHHRQRRRARTAENAVADTDAGLRAQRATALTASEEAGKLWGSLATAVSALESPIDSVAAAEALEEAIKLWRSLGHGALPAEEGAARALMAQAALAARAEEAAQRKARRTFATVLGQFGGHWRICWRLY
eukprot:4018082-Pyramimonas_sp.AAC.1